MPLSPEQNPLVRDSLRSLPPRRSGHPFLMPRRRGPGGVPRIFLDTVDPPGFGNVPADEPVVAPGEIPPEVPTGAEPPGVVAPEPPPVVAAAPPPVIVSAPAAPAVIPTRTFPVQLSFDLAANSVTGQAVRSISGPVVIEHIFVRSALDIQADDFWDLFRVDFSRDSVVQSLSFNETGAPTGHIPDDRTLFEYGAIEDTNSRFNGTSEGWYRMLGGSVSAGSFELSLPVSLAIFLDEVFIKVYVQNDAATVRQFFVSLTVRQLESFELPPPVPSGEPPVGPTAPVPGPEVPGPGVVPVGSAIYGIKRGDLFPYWLLRDMTLPDAEATAEGWSVAGPGNLFVVYNQVTEQPVSRFLV